MKQIRITIVCMLFSLLASAQLGKDNAGNISTTATVNIYKALTANANAGSSTIAVTNTTGLSVGDLILIIQMQGASVNPYINIWGNPNSPEPLNNTFGRVTNYNTCGNNEFAQIASMSGNTITIDCALTYSYSTAGKSQIVRVPRYTTLNITNTGTITAPAWNGTVGGIVALEVAGNSTINPTGRIDASALGFRGGTVTAETNAVFGGGAWGHSNPLEGAYKGESIAGDVLTYSVNFQGLYCKGAVANGGGGGNGNNAGGGGGANGGDTSLYNGYGNPDLSVGSYSTAWNLESPGFYSVTSSGGGRGGYTFSTASLSPITFSPNSNNWGAASDFRRVQGGMGGRPLNYNTGRVFLGGGGGAGDENDTYGGAGGNGGGIVFFLSYGTISGGGQIIADGQAGYNTKTNPAPANAVGGRDGAGGGGGGGAIIINSTGGISSLTLSARGGVGGNQNMVNNLLFGTTAMAYGPGGGGGGGAISTTNATVTTVLTGGNNGIVQYLSGTNNCQIDDLFPANGATKGGAGTNRTNSLTALPTITVGAGVSVCSNNSATVTAGTNGTTTIGWYSAAAGGTLLGSGSPFTTSVFPSPGNYTVWAGFCPGGIYRVPVTITVTTGPTITAIASTVCAGQTGTVSASGATTYTWNTGSNSTSITASPSVTTIYTVQGSTGGCTSSRTVAINIVNLPTVSVTSGSVCSGSVITLTASGAGTYTWNTGATTNTISVSPTVQTVYTVTGANGGSCTATNSSTVTIGTVPTLSLNANSFSICGIQIATIVATANNGTYLWSTGSTSSVITTNLGGVYTVTVTNVCGSSTQAATVTTGASPNFTINPTSTLICNSQSVTLNTAGSTGTFVWSNGANNTPSISTNLPGAYSATLTNACGSATYAINLNAGPSTTLNLASSAPTLCVGTTVTITATGTGTVNWSNGVNNAPSITVTNTGVYTATLNNSCGSTVSSVSINPGSAPFFILSATSNSLCSGGTVTISTVGNGTVNWSTGINNASSITITNTGVYTATMSNSCGSSTANITIVSGSAPSINITPSSASFCNGQTATLTASGASGTYSWNTGTSGSVLTTTSPGTYTAVVSNSCGVGTQTYNLSFLALPSVSLSAPKTTICSGESLTLTASGINGGSVYAWSSSSNTGSVETVSNGGNIVVTYTNACGSSSSSLSILQSTLTPDFTFSPNGGIAPVSISFSNTSVNNISNSWSLGNGLTSQTVQPVTSYTAAGIYTVSLVITNNDGCQASISKTLEVTESGLGIVPEVLTPNNDGKNDLFEIKGIDKFQNSELEIFNRWGNVVYRKKGYDNSWDGSPNIGGGSGKLPAGTYFYILKLNDPDNKIFRGYVELMY